VGRAARVRGRPRRSKSLIQTARVPAHPAVSVADLNSSSRPRRPRGGRRPATRRLRAVRASAGRSVSPEPRSARGRRQQLGRSWVGRSKTGRAGPGVGGEIVVGAARRAALEHVEGEAARRAEVEPEPRATAAARRRAGRRPVRVRHDVDPGAAGSSTSSRAGGRGEMMDMKEPRRLKPTRARGPEAARPAVVRRPCAAIVLDPRSGAMGAQVSRPARRCSCQVGHSGAGAADAEMLTAPGSVLRRLKDAARGPACTPRPNRRPTQVVTPIQGSRPGRCPGSRAGHAVCR